MRSGWEVKQLNCVASIDKIKHVSGSAIYVGLEDITSNTLQFIGEMQPVDGKSSTFDFTPEHFLYGRLRPYLNKALLPDFSGHCSSEIFPIFPFEELDRSYLGYWMTSETMMAKIDATCTGARMPRANMAEVMSFEIPIPPLEEQKRIVAVLDAAFEGLTRAKENAEANLQNARKLFEARLKVQFEPLPSKWHCNKLTDICSKIGSGATPKGGKSSYKSEGVSLVRSLNIHDRDFRHKNLAFIDDDQAKKLSNVDVKKNDVLLNITGASVARCALIDNSILPARVNQHVAIIRPADDQVLPEFLCYLLTSDPFKKALLKTGEEGGATRQAITKAQIQTLEVSYPTKRADQEAICARLKRAENSSIKLVECYTTKLTDIADLRQSLLQKAFAGELT